MNGSAPVRPRSTVSMSLLALAVLVATALVSCTASPGPQTGGGASPSSAPPGARAALSVGVANDVPGFDLLVSPETNQRAGFDYDLVNWLGLNADPGFRPNLTPITIDKREDAIRDNGVDLVVDVLPITPQRASVIGVAGPYILSRQGFLTRQGEPTVMNLDQLVGGVSVCAIRGSSSETRLRPLNDQGRIVLTTEVGPLACAQRLAAREVSTYSSDQLVLKGVEQYDRYRGMFTLSSYTVGGLNQYGIGYQKGDLRMCTMLTDGIRKLIVDGKWRDFFVANFPGLDPNGDYEPDPQQLNRCE